MSWFGLANEHHFLHRMPLILKRTTGWLIERIALFRIKDLKDNVLKMSESAHSSCDNNICSQHTQQSPVPGDGPWMGKEAIVETTLHFHSLILDANTKDRPLMKTQRAPTKYIS